MSNIDTDKVLNALTKIALVLEKEIDLETTDDNLIGVRNRARAHSTLSTIHAVLGDDWLVRQLTLYLKEETKDPAPAEVKTADTAAQRQLAKALGIPIDAEERN